MLGWAHTLRSKESRRNENNNGNDDSNNDNSDSSKNNERNGNENSVGSSSSSSDNKNDNDKDDNSENNDNDDDENKDNNENENENNEHSIPKEIFTAIRPKNISYKKMSKIGKMIKRIIDHGRIEYLRCFSLDTKIIKYCDSLLSPECYMIISTRI